MSVLADFPIDPQVIIVLIAVVFTAIKALFERGKSKEDEYDEEELMQQYEAELRRQQTEVEIRPATPQPSEDTLPPPLPAFTAAPAVPREPAKPVRPTLSAAEKKALENLQRRAKGTRKPRPSQSTKSRVYRHLSSPTAAREALLLSEILGPPKAFKESR